MPLYKLGLLEKSYHVWIAFGEHIASKRFTFWEMDHHLVLHSMQGLHNIRLDEYSLLYTFILTLSVYLPDFTIK